MKSSRKFRRIGRQIEEAVGLGSNDSAVLRSIGWVSAGVTVLAVGLMVGRELRLRYKFNHRTPYDAYAHAGDQAAQDVEFGLGV
jgi:hypothetical protein